jgi:hypothetical protein
MISPRNPTVRRALRYYADAEGDGDSRGLGVSLWPLPKLTSTRDYLAWRAARAEAERDRDAKASRLTRRMAEAGLIESRGRPLLADWFRAKWDKRTARILTDWRPLGYPMALDQDRARDEALAALVGDTMRRSLVWKVAKGPPSVAAVLGDKPSGATKRAWSALCDEGIVLPPARRWLTEKGRAALCTT